MALSYNPKIITNGLVLCLDAANRDSYPGSGTLWNDLSGNRYNFSLVNSPTFSSSNSGILTFNGTNQHSTVTGPSIGTDDYALELWARFTSLPSNGVLFDSNSADNAGDGIMITYSGGNLYFRYRGSFTPFVSTASITASTWYHFAMVRNGSTVTAYINGSSIGTFSETARNLSSTRYTIGTYTVRNNFYFPGNVSSLKVYKGVTLGQTEIQQNFNALRGRYGI
jgi:hypothetical protein